MKLNPHCFLKYVKLFRPSFEVVKEGRIFPFVSGDRRFEILNLESIRDLDRMSKLEEIISIVE